MIIEEEVEELRQSLSDLNAYNQKELIRRSEWGSINFEQGESHINSIFRIATDLLDLPLEYIAYDSKGKISSGVTRAMRALKRIDLFRLESAGEPTRGRDEIYGELQSASEELTRAVESVIPYLEFRRGNITGKIELINNAIKTAKDNISKTTDWIDEQKKEVENIVQQARETSASVGVERFTPEFNKEADRLEALSENWLITTAIFAAVTIVASIFFYFWSAVPEDATGWDIIQKGISKVAIIAVLFTATIWCGRIYRALTHQATVNRHRALSLKTFQTFVEGTDDPQVRDAVLVAATNTVFANVPTGFVETGSDKSSKVNVDLGNVHKIGLEKE